VIILGLFANALAAGLLAFTIFFYAVIYSMWLKRSTAQNIVIGGAAGAFPPMIGQAVMTGSFGIESLILFGIIFLWTPPHFWALALIKADDYARANVPMMPNVAGPDSTRRQILAYSCVVVPFAGLPFIIGFGGLAYGLAAGLMGAAFLGFVVRVFVFRQGVKANKAAGQLFAFSILYLFTLFMVLLLEHLPWTKLMIFVSGGAA
jgi:heme o synthase